jgi:membrane protease YdiL (CAAX protease family)
MDGQDRKSALCFLTLTFGISSIFWGRSFRGAPLSSVVPFLMWTPGVCAIVTQLIFHRPIANLGWRSGPLRYLALSMTLPLIYCAAIYVPVWILGAGRFNGGFLARVYPLVPLALVQNVFFALGEEIGWRGFLVPALYRMRGFGWAGVASGVIWSIWHVPLIVFGGYDSGTPAWYAVTCFMISVTAMSVTVAWLRLRSGSLWTAALYHGVHNLTIQELFDGSTIDTGLTKWITTEFGIGLTFATVAMSLYFWRRRGELAR